MRLCLLIVILMLSLEVSAKPTSKPLVELSSTQPLRSIPVDTVTPKISTKDVALFIPTDLKPTKDSSLVANKIADRSISYLMNNSAMKDASLMKSATSLQEKMKADVEIPSSGPEGVTHRFTMKYEIFQALAKFEYVGWLKAALNYDAKASCTDITIQEKIFNNKNLYLKQKVSSVESQSSLGISWAW